MELSDIGFVSVLLRIVKECESCRVLTNGFVAACFLLAGCYLAGDPLLTNGFHTAYPVLKNGTVAARFLLAGFFLTGGPLWTNGFHTAYPVLKNGIVAARFLLANFFPAGGFL